MREELINFVTQRPTPFKRDSGQILHRTFCGAETPTLMHKVRCHLANNHAASLLLFPDGETFWQEHLNLLANLGVIRKAPDKCAPPSY